MKESSYRITWKKFDYINFLTDFFDKHREYELIAFSVWKNNMGFIAVYKDYSRQNEQS